MTGLIIRRRPLCGDRRPQGATIGLYEPGGGMSGGGAGADGRARGLA